jgi:ribosomal protein S16
LKRGHTWVISVSGGVAIYSWSLADGAKPSDTVKAVRTQAAPDENANWWWN